MGVVSSPRYLDAPQVESGSPHGEVRRQLGVSKAICLSSVHG
jgi:hypothetical protein